MIAAAVLDSGPLFSTLALHYAYRDPGDRPRRTDQIRKALPPPLQDEPDQHFFLDGLKAIRRKLTTAHAVAELGHLEKTRIALRGGDRDAFCTAVLTS